MKKNELGSITLIQAAVVASVGAVFFLAVIAFRTTIKEVSSYDKCAVESANIDYADPNLNGRNACQ